MDNVYIGDIPNTYHYARFGSNYIDLFDRKTLHNGTYNYYRVYLYDNLFVYDTGYYSVSQYQTVDLADVPVSNNFMERKDIDAIFLVVFIFCLFFVFLTNLFTSIVKKGGVFGGLL